MRFLWCFWFRHGGKWALGGGAWNIRYLRIFGVFSAYSSLFSFHLFLFYLESFGWLLCKSIRRFRPLEFFPGDHFRSPKICSFSCGLSTFVAISAVDSVAPRTKGGGTKSFSDLIETGNVGWYDFAPASSGGKESICLEIGFEIPLFGKFSTWRSYPYFSFVSMKSNDLPIIFELVQVVSVADDRGWEGTGGVIDERRATRKRRDRLVWRVCRGWLAEDDTSWGTGLVGVKFGGFGGVRFHRRHGLGTKREGGGRIY